MFKNPYTVAAVHDPRAALAGSGEVPLLLPAKRIQETPTPPSPPDDRLLEDVLPDALPDDLCIEGDEVFALPDGAIELRIDPNAPAYVRIPPDADETGFELIGGIDLEPIE